MTEYRDTLGMEYVYVSEATNEYLKVNISIILGDNDTEIYIMPQQMITCGELQTVIDYLGNDILRKLIIKITENCTVYVKYDGVTYLAELDDGVVTAVNEQSAP
jgi:hypothetical protein